MYVFFLLYASSQWIALSGVAIFCIPQSYIHNHTYLELSTLQVSGARMELQHGTAHINMRFPAHVAQRDMSRGEFNVMGVATGAEAHPPKAAPKKKSGPYQSASLNSMCVGGDFHFRHHLCISCTFYLLFLVLCNIII